MKLPAQSVRDRYKQTSGALDGIAKAIREATGCDHPESYRRAVGAEVVAPGLLRVPRPVQLGGTYGDIDGSVPFAEYDLVPIEESGSNPRGEAA